MKKNSFKNNINEIKKVSHLIPKSINEAINFNELDNDELDDDFGDETEEPIEEPIETSVEEPVKEEDGLGVETFINDTRKKALNIMAKLADEPESKTYDIAKRIWQICDKSIADEKSEQETNQQNKPIR